MKTEKNKLFGLILAGGHSQRMGQDKSALSYHGKPQAEHVRDLLKNVCAEIFISARPGQLAYDMPVIEDVPPFVDIGPLGGILSAMTTHPGVSWLVMACDLPFADEKTLCYLI